MVCMYCVIVPVLIFIWFKYLLPLIDRYVNSLIMKDAQVNAIEGGPEFAVGAKKKTMKKNQKKLANGEQSNVDNVMAAIDEEPQPTLDAGGEVQPNETKKQI